MNHSNIKFSPDKFKCFVRYLVQAAKEKRCVPYYEIENLFGFSHIQAGLYSGRLGDFCLNKGWPALNSLIISSTECVPSEGFDWYQNEFGKSWGELVSECWKHFHVTSTRTKQVQDFSGIDKDISNFLKI